ncbi:MAG: polysaccharide biosynthesis tyrosine autokinase [Nostocaceae cyanobacterium]|nr:polysaccharide biosynthesis tyrosine autokinase [Nostocaceae cyanobacterium]
MEIRKSIVYFDKCKQVVKRRLTPSLGVFFPVFLVSILTSFLREPIYEAEGKLLFQRINLISSSTEVTGVGQEIDSLQQVEQHNQNNILNTEAQILTSDRVVQKTIDKLKLKDNKGTPLKIKQFMNRLTVKDIKGTDVIKVSYKDKDPQTSAEVVNTLMTVYLEENQSPQTAQVEAAQNFLKQQLPKAESGLRQVEAEIAEFKQKNNIVSLQHEATKAVEMITELDKKIADVKSRIANISAQAKKIREQLGMNSQQAVAMTSLSQSIELQGLLKDIQWLESEIIHKRAILEDNHPEVLHLQNQLEALKQLLEERVKQVPGFQQVDDINGKWHLAQLQQQLTARLVELESNRLGLASELATLSSLSLGYKQRLNQIPELEQQLRQLERKLQAVQSTYLLLLQKQQETRIGGNQNQNRVQIISQAQIPEKPKFSPIFYYLVSAIVSTLASLATMLILEAKDQSIKTIEEAKELLGFTVLGVIPTFKKVQAEAKGNEQEPQLYSQGLVVRDIPNSLITEAYRMLRANLKFMSAGQDLKVIVVTSSIPKEGKSTVAANLALAMAQMERKVLLVDADLHHPSQHQVWEICNTQGLSNVIVEQVEIMAAIKKLTNNLDILPAGVIPPSAASVIDTKRMTSLINSFASYYDYVIVDAPSLNVAADATTLGQMADGVLLVVRPGVVDYFNAVIASQLLEKSGQNVIGQVINAIIPENESHHYYFQEDYYSQKTNSNTVELVRN